MRAWLAGRTLRGRLIAGLVALLFVACAAVGVVTYLSLHGFLLGQLDDQLQSASMRFTMCVDGPPGDHSPGPDSPGERSGDPDGDHDPAQCADTPGQASGTFSAALSSGAVTAANVTYGDCKLRAADKSMLARLPADGRAYTERLASLDRTYRLMAVSGTDGRVLVTGLPTDPMTDTLNNVELTEVIVFAAALLLTGLFGTGWVRLSLRPLRRVTATAAQVARLPLASQVELPHRVPDADPRTEVGQLGTAFNRMLGHVESALARREASESRLRRFAADASHELRTPLAAIRGYAELARRRGGTLPPEVEHALGRVESEAARMSALVDDLLLLARLDAGRPLESGPVDLTRLAIDATSDARAAGPDHRWRLELPDGPVLVSGDDQRLHQVLANLLSNARTHTPAGTTVTVAVAPARSADGPLAELSVTDDGPGIPAELQPDLFERFVRGDSSRSRAAGSTGLGLSIVAAVIAAHQGTAAVTSEPGRTRFLITLPLLRDPPAAPRS
ncbi:MAG TPA: HAMP domain-containing sensor histidine kinase [Streptosporangiaceae bacterium]|nr:HAMP domain-containing sensor histidine kinase [Streptosporangiaceae bacterium]